MLNAQVPRARCLISDLYCEPWSSAGLSTRHLHACIDSDVDFGNKFHAQRPSNCPGGGLNSRFRIAVAEMLKLQFPIIYKALSRSCPILAGVPAA